MKNSHNTPAITLLDGGMGRELLRMGAPFRQPQWSAVALMETPELVQKAHENFAKAGSQVLTTSNYAVVPYHLGDDHFLRDGAALTELAGKLAREAADNNGCRVAGSLPPPFGSYRPDLFDEQSAKTVFSTIVQALSPNIDVWLAETVSSRREAQTVAEAVKQENQPLWISYTLQDTIKCQRTGPCLRSGEPLAETIGFTIGLGAAAILFNCSQPEVMLPAVKTAISELERLDGALDVGVYANAFSPLPADCQANTQLQDLRGELGPQEYLQFAQEWCDHGATIIGGCCGIGPEHITALKEELF